MAWCRSILLFCAISISTFSKAFSALSKSRVTGLIMEEQFSVSNPENIEKTLNSIFRERGELANVPVILSEAMMGFSGASVREVKCVWKGENTNLPKKVFIKNIILEPPKDTDEDALYKWRRNRQSYINEITFLAQYAPRLVQNKVRVPETYKVLQQGTHEGSGENAENFLFVSESMVREDTKQVIELESEQFKSAIRWLAGLHASYYGKLPAAASSAEEEKSNVWREGTHLALSKRPKKELENLPQNWAKFCKAFGWPAFGDLGARVATLAPKIAAQLSPSIEDDPSGSSSGGSGTCVGRSSYTMVHGDAKPANLFFVDGSGQEDGDIPPALETYAIDFQWAGWGLASTDLIYLIATGLGDSQINRLDLENDVLGYYHKVFNQELTASGAGEDVLLSYDELQYQFQLATIDYVRWIMACRLPGETPAKFAKRREEMDPNLGSYRRSEGMMLWLLSRVEEFLPLVEANLN